jgi:hypothetical protein
MITPTSIADWMLLGGSLATLTALALVGHRWTLREEARSAPTPAPAHPALVPIPIRSRERV